MLPKLDNKIMLSSRNLNLVTLCKLSKSIGLSTVLHLNLAVQVTR